jgi:predicted ATP-grasp superfamily ATP-dependent carboligase
MGDSPVNESAVASRVFVSEYVTGGAWPEADVPQSLRIEGRAMAVAVAADLAAVDGWRVVTTWDRRLGPSPFPAGIDVVPVGSPQEEPAEFLRLARECAAALVIAPEFDGLLEQRCRVVESAGGRLLGCSAEAVARCADKLALAELLGRQGLPVVPTSAASADATPDRWPVVLKPRDGAGSLDVRLARSAAEWHAAWTHSAPRGPAGFVVQPLVSGAALSAAALIGDGGQVEVWPLARQRLSDDGRFTYQGGEVPAAEAPRWQAAAEELVRSVIQTVSRSARGLRGYVGFDLIADEQAGRLWLVEINPRLTTSYIGYRALAADNLATRLVGSNEPARWHSGSVRFMADGRVTQDV